MRNKDPMSFAIREFGRISINDMQFIDLSPEMKFNYLENIIHFLKDKTNYIYIIIKSIIKSMHFYKKVKETKKKLNR